MKMIFKALAALSFLLPQTATAQTPRLNDIVQSQMHPGWEHAPGTYIAAVNLRMAENWMTYWRHPGETGLVPRLDWSGSENVAQVRVLWPEPRLYIKAGFASIGYSREVLLPIEVTATNPGQPVKLDAILSVGVCNDICIPVDLALQMDMPGTKTPDRAIASVMNNRPRAARGAGLRAIDCTITPEQKGVRFSASLDMPVSGEREFLLIEMAGVPMRALPSKRDGRALVGHSLIRTDGATAIDRSNVSFSVVSERGMVSHQGCALSN